MKIMNRIALLGAIVTLVVLLALASSSVVLLAQDPQPLTGLTVSPGTLSPAFSSSTDNYTVSGITHDNNRITFDATTRSGYQKDLWVVYLGIDRTIVTPSDGGVYSARDLGPITDGHQVALGYGENRYRYYVAQNLVDRTSTSGDSVYTYTITITRPKPPLTISGITQKSYNENGTEHVASYNVSSAFNTNNLVSSLFGNNNDAAVTWSLSGDDNDDFSLRSPDSSSQPTTILYFSQSPDYENPTDANTDNEYLVRVEAVTANESNSLDVTVTVQNVNESPTLMPNDG